MEFVVNKKTGWWQENSVRPDMEIDANPEIRMPTNHLSDYIWDFHNFCFASAPILSKLKDMKNGNKIIDTKEGMHAQTCLAYSCGAAVTYLFNSLQHG